MSEVVDNETGLIYKITSPSGKIYIGQTTKGFDYRWKQHIKDAMNKDRKRCRIFHNAIRKYGSENMITEVIYECDENLLDEKENHFIYEYNSLSPNGYNLKTNKIGEKKGEVTEKFKENVSKAVLNYYETNPNAEESREKIRVAKKSYHQNNDVNIKHTEKTKQKISNGLNEYYENNKHPQLYHDTIDNLPKHYHSICIYNEKEKHTFINLTEAGNFLSCNRTTVRRYIGKEYKGYKITECDNNMCFTPKKTQF